MSPWDDITRYMAERTAQVGGIILPEDWSDYAIKNGLIDPLTGKANTGMFDPTPLIFTAREPSCFYQDEGGIPYRGHENVKRRVDVKIQAMRPDARFKCLLVGPAGAGKTALARIVASRIMQARESLGFPRGRYFELLPNQIGDRKDLDTFMGQLKEFDIVFIDEVHILQRQMGGPEILYHTLHDTGLPKYPLAEGKGWIEVPPTVSWLGATTEPGSLDDALRRRFQPEFRIDHPGDETLVEILHDQEMPIVDGAAWAIAQRSGGLPWQAISVYGEARDFAVVEGKASIEPDDAQEAFNAMGLDEYGLLPEDRKIIAVLFQSPYELKTTGQIIFRMSETALCAAAGIDRETYKRIIQPKMMRLGFLTTVGGQSLTTKAVETFRAKND